MDHLGRHNHHSTQNSSKRKSLSKYDAMPQIASSCKYFGDHLTYEDVIPDVRLSKSRCRYQASSNRRQSHSYSVTHRNSNLVLGKRLCDGARYAHENSSLSNHNHLDNRNDSHLGHTVSVDHNDYHKHSHSDTDRLHFQHEHHYNNDYDREHCDSQSRSDKDYQTNYDNETISRDDSDSQSYKYKTTCINKTFCQQHHDHKQLLPFSATPTMSPKSKTSQKYAIYDSHNDASPRRKFGSDALLTLSASQDLNARLTLESFREQIESAVRNLNRNDLLPKLADGQHSPIAVDVDLVEQYYTKQHCKEKTSQDRPVEWQRLRSKTRKLQDQQSSAASAAPSTCEVKMRVKIQYKSHEHALADIESVKETSKEQQLDKFSQATSILRDRDTSCVVCVISFNDITYLGAFWRDYTNGTLCTALKSVFLTELMRPPVGDETLELLVSIDEKDYMKGKNVLIQNLQCGRKISPTSSGINVNHRTQIPLPNATAEH